MARDPRVDAYIERQAEFAKPILEQLREAVHAACPPCEETIKWGMPAFLYKGSILAQMAAFKAHATFGFWQGAAVVGDTERRREAMGSFGRIVSLEDLPDGETMHGLIAKAMQLVDSGEKAPRPAKHSKPAFETPPDLSAALAANDAARQTFESFPPSCRREYVDWVTEAKRPETRAKRLAQAVEWMAKGKRRNWKYEQC
nr:YdeI/OmpD-associated family protein [uncultured Sphingosinicella sp.]